MTQKGRTLNLFFIDGNPDGMLTAEIFGWTGHVLMTPRTQLVSALNREEAKSTGVYILLGEDENGPLAYIGEAEDISQRIKRHDATRGWWSQAVIVTTTQRALNKAHAKYLEFRLVSIAKQVKKIPLENGNAPSEPSLSEAEKANMEAFLDNILVVLPALRIDFLSTQRRNRDAASLNPEANEGIVRFELKSKKHNLHATARLEDGEFIVEEGSTSRGQWVGKNTQVHPYIKLLEELISQNIICKQPESEQFMFLDDYAFNSPSAAASAINGRSSNGTVEWKLQGTQKTYKAWEKQQIN